MRRQARPCQADERDLAFSVDPEYFKERNISLKQRLFKSGFRRSSYLLLRKNVFTYEFSEIFEGYLLKMDVSLAKRENSLKKRSVGGVQMKFEAAFGKVAKAVYHDGKDSDYSSDTGDELISCTYLKSVADNVNCNFTYLIYFSRKFHVIVNSSPVVTSFLVTLL